MSATPALVQALHARASDAQRIDGYYAPLALACDALVASAPRRPCVVGVQGAQGCGKSTLTSALVDALADVGVRAVAVSVDDFYLTRAEQVALAARHPGDRSLEHRGNPGTHDVALGRNVLAALTSLRAGDETRVPVYDKSAHGGRGDRAPEERWRRVAGPLDLILVEGWMLGFSPVDGRAVPASLVAPNAYLAAYAAWPAALDAFIRLDVPALDTIVRWRVDAERARRERGEPALTDDDARDYIERFLASYEVYLPRLRERPPCAHVIAVQLGEDRMPLRAAGAPRA